MRPRITHSKLSLAAFAAASALAGMLAAQPALADIFTSSVNIGNTGLNGFSGPFANVTVDRTSSTTATITFTSNTVNGNIYLMGDDGSGAAAVNLNATSFSVSNITGTNAGTGFTVGPLTQSSGSMDGFGNFNLAIDDFDGFTHSADTISFTVTDTSGTWASAASVLIANASGYDAATHTFVTSSPANAANGAITTGFAAEKGGTTPVPEPNSLASMGFGLAALGLFLGWRRRRV